MQFFKDFLLVVNSLTEQQQKKQTSEQSSIIFFVIIFIQRLSLLFPQDGYNQNLYQDVFLYLIYRFVSPFNVASILNIWGDATLIYVMIILIALVNISMFLTLIFLTILYRFELYDPLLPKEFLQIISKIVYKYIMYLEYTLYIPMISILLGSINCRIMPTKLNCTELGVYGMVIFALVFLIIMTFTTVYFFRTYKYWPENTLQKKFTYLALLMPVVNFLHIYFNYQGRSKFSNTIKLMLANMTGVIWIYELLIVTPYIPSLNSLMLNLAILYETIAIILSVGIGSNQTLILTQNLTIYFVFYGSLVLFVTIPIRQYFQINLLKQKNLNQYETISLIQMMNDFQYSKTNSVDRKMSSSKIIKWYFVLVNHYRECNQISCREIRDSLYNLKNKDYQMITRYFAQCILNTQLNVMRSKKNYFYETLELFYISFQNDECNDPLPAYCSLKSYQQREDLHSFQFKSIKDHLNLDLQSKIIQRQKRYQKLISNDIQDKQLTTAQIYQCDLLREKFISQFQDVIDLKISYWVNLMNGHNDISDYSHQIIRLSQKVNQIKLYLEKELRLSLNNSFKPNPDTNVLILKILSIYFALAINDYEFLNQCLICEDQIDETLRSELSFSPDLVFNANLIKDQVVLLSISTMKNRGQLLYRNKLQISKYFGYTEMKDFDKIDHVNQLMPDFVRVIHDSIIANFLAKGSSDRFIKAKMLFLKDCDGFLFPANQKIQNFFEQTDDYVLTAEFNKVREFNDFILFDSYGQILGVTKNLFSVITKDGVNQNLRLEKLLNCYIFLLIPNIVSLIEKHLQSLNLSDNEVFQQEQQTFFNIPNDLLKLSYDFNQFRSTHKQHTQTKHKLLKIFQTQFKSKHTVESKQTVDQSEGTEKKSLPTDRLIQNCSIDLLKKDYNEIITDFLSMKQNDESKQDQTQFIIRNILEFRKIGRGQHQFPFFFLEITDIKNTHHQDNNQTLTMNDTNQRDYISIADLTAPSYEYIANPLKSSEFGQTDKLYSYGFKEGRQRKQGKFPEEHIPVDLKLADISEIQENRDLHQQEFADFNSARLALMIAPISQRHNFIQPQSHRSQILINEDYCNIELDFKNLQDSQSQNINASSYKGAQNHSNLDQINNVTKRGLLLQNIKESIEEFDIQNQDGQQRSSKKNQDSHQIQKIINKHRKNIVHNEPEINQSNSSRTSMTARRGTLDIIKNLRTRTKFNKDLRQIFFVYVSVVLFISISMVACVILNINNANALMSRVNDVIEPQKFSSSYFAIFIFGWLNLAQKMNIIGLSNYMEQQILNQTQTIQQNINKDMLARYQIFALIENDGLLDKLNISFVEEPKINETSFSIFFFLTLDKMNSILNLDFSNPQPDNQFVMDLLYLRENMGQVIKVNQDLINTITDIYHQDIIMIAQQVLTLFLAQVFILSFLILFTIILWVRFSGTQQKIMMFNARVYPTLAQQMLLKFLVAKDVIQQNINIRWKLFNYFDLMYRPIEETDYLSLKIDLRLYQGIIFPEKAQKNKSPSHSHHQKSTLLSSRIRQTTVRFTMDLLLTLIVLTICILQLVGGYILLVKQEVIRSPSETLVMQLVKFQNQFDTLMVTGLLAKTQYLVYPSLIERKFFTTNHIESISNIQLKTSDYVIDYFQQSYQYTQSHLDGLWQDIQGDELLQNVQQAEILDIYKVSLCINLYYDLPFCQLQDMGKDNFQQLYGFYDEQANNVQLVNSGMIVIISEIFQKIKQSFNYELQNNAYLQDKSMLQNYTSSQEFSNDYISYFLDYDKALTLIQDMIVVQIEYILYSDSISAQLYFLISGFSLLILLCIFFWIWLEKRNKKIQNLRMGITNIPIEVLFETQMMVMLKKLDGDW